MSNHQKGEDHPYWRGGISNHYYRPKAFAAHGAVCSACGTTETLVVHHKDGNRRNSGTENLEVLCGTCHQQAHRATHCPKGHEFTPGNTVYYIQRGYKSRRCRICSRHWTQAWRARQKELSI